MKKTIWILLIIVLCVLAYIAYAYNSYKISVYRTNKTNAEFENFTNSDILGTSLITVINKAIDYNNKNNITTNADGTYIQNDKNSIAIEVKFLESENTFSMESISKLGSEEFIKNYGAMSFKCTKKEYHEKTKNIKYLLFEQI